MVRQPVGVVGAITPFNFPAMIPLWFLPFAVACGNTFVLKPSEQDPLTSVRIFELIEEHEIFPPGVVNLVHGGRDAVNALIDCEDIDAISFVGSAKTARYVASRAAERASAPRRWAAPRTRWWRCPTPTRRCSPPASPPRPSAPPASAASRARCWCWSATRPSRTAASQTVVEASRALTVGAGGEAATDVCPLVSADSRERVAGEIERALGEGAEAVLDGREATAGRAAPNLGPTILDRVPADAPAVEEELFGPVLTVLRAADLDSAIERVNTSRYGNASVIFTTSGGAARAYPRGVRGGDDRRQHRRRRADRLVPLLRLEGLDRRRPPRQRHRRGRLLHAQEGGHRPLVRAAYFRAPIRDQKHAARRGPLGRM